MTNPRDRLPTASLSRSGMTDSAGFLWDVGFKTGSGGPEIFNHDSPVTDNMKEIFCILTIFIR
jgi:hypothetical protein